MNRTIHKYDFDDEPELTIPWTRVKVVHVAQQSQVLPTVWAEVSGTQTQTGHKLHVIGTGWPVPEHLEHVGSAVCGDFVWHVYREA